MLHVHNIDKLTSWPLRLKLGEPAPVIEPLEFVSGECGSRFKKWWFLTDRIYELHVCNCINQLYPPDMRSWLEEEYAAPAYEATVEASE